MLDRTLPPPFSLSHSLNLLKPHQVNLQTGAKLFFINGGEQQVVKLELIFHAGRWYEDIPGISYFTAHLLAKGTKTKTSKQIADTLESLGMHLEITPGFDFVSVSLFGLTKHFSEALETLVEICVRPCFPSDELDQFKSIFLQTLKINREKTSYLASTAFRKNLFGQNHPYGNEVDESHVNQILSEKLGSFHAKHYKHFTAFITGRLSEALQASIIERLAQIPVQEVRLFSAQISVPGKGSVHIKKTDSIQASLRLGKLVISRNHPDYPALVLANHAIGGYFGSRLMQRLREDKGLTYGIHSAIHPLIRHAYFIISADVSKEHKNFATEEIKSTLQDFRTYPLEGTELQVVKNHFLGSLFTEINTPFAHTEKLKNIYLHQLESDYYQNLVIQIQKISAEKLAKIAEEHLHESNLLIITAG
ncbi:MAG: insulinase family protein [Flammeovirgaceae bacterium]|nr:MAG: insulinase family protein [Flammeovirgaceae bacterium]